MARIEQPVFVVHVVNVAIILVIGPIIRPWLIQLEDVSTIRESRPSLVDLHATGNEVMLAAEVRAEIRIGDAPPILLAATRLLFSAALILWASLILTASVIGPVTILPVFWPCGFGLAFLILALHILVRVLRVLPLLSLSIDVGPPRSLSLLSLPVLRRTLSALPFLILILPLCWPRLSLAIRLRSSIVLVLVLRRRAQHRSQQERSTNPTHYRTSVHSHPRFKSRVKYCSLEHVNAVDQMRFGVVAVAE
jgi:hypothetical protein